MRKILISIWLISCVFGAALAQVSKGTIKGQLVQDGGTKPVALATITVFNAKDTSLITYRLSNDNGEFSIPDLPLGLPLRILFTHVGRKIIRQEFTISSVAVVSLGKVVMPKDTASLGEVIIRAEIPPVIVRNDTVEFNAAAFKTLPNALVEDLLKKLPGLLVDRDGNITYNNKRVNKIMVDGRDFFGSDPKIASRNLPANIIDKIQVTDDKDAKYINPTALEWEIPQVINLKFKKDIKKGWFGKVFGGYGTHKQYEAGAMINSFRDTLQMSFIGFANNINKTGFSSKDLLELGGFNRSGFNNMNGNGSGALNIDGVSFGGGTTGRASQAGLGTNINTILGKGVVFNLQYFYGNEHTNIDRLVKTDQFIKDTTLSTLSKSLTTVNTNSHQLSASLRKVYSPSRNLYFKPTVNYINMASDAGISTSAVTNKNGLISVVNNAENILRSRWEYSHDLIYTDSRFRKPGGVFRISNSFSASNGLSNQFNRYDATYYVSTAVSTFVTQLRRTDAPSFLSRSNFSYANPLSKKTRLTGMASIDNFSDEQDIITFNKENTTNDYTAKVDSVSGQFSRTGYKSLVNGTLSWTINNDLFLNIGANWQWINIQNKFKGKPTISQDYHYIWPAVRLQLRRNVLSYNARTIEPQAADLQPVLNNTNPLFLTLGNISLKPYTLHTIGFTTGQYDGRKPLTFNIGLTYTIFQDAIVRARAIDSKGVQFSQPVNVDGVSSFSIYGGVSDRIKFNKDWTLVARLLNTSSYFHNVVLVNNKRSISETFTNTPSIEFNFNWRDKIEFYPKYSLANNNTAYEDPSFSNLHYTTHRIENGLVLRLVKRLVFEASVDYQYNPMLPVGIRKDMTLLNAAVNYVFLKDDRGVLKLSGYDLLNQNTGIARMITENIIQVTETQLIRQYFLISLTYNIRKFGTKTVGGKEGLFRL